MPAPDLDSIATPALVIDLARAQGNIDRLAAYGRQHGLAIRPHTKTHKSLFFARRQVAAGAIGLTAAKVGEARIMAEAHDDILLAYPALDPARAAAAADLGRTHTLRVAIDSAFAADALATAARQAGSTLGILVDLDVGMHRTGVQTPQLALELAQHVDLAPGLRLDGLFIYPGHIACPSPQQPAALAAIQSLVVQTLDLWKRHGLAAPIVSSGSTPTAYQSHHTPAVTEIRPGTYIYNDRNYLVGGWCSLEDCAARILATVVSTAVPDHCVLDAGSKTLTQDRLLRDPDTAGHGLLVEYPQAVIAKLTEEHAVVDLTRCSDRPRLGQRLTIVPNHICPCVNLQDAAWLRLPDGSLEPLPIDARGKLS